MSSPPSFINQYLPPLSNHLQENNETFYDPTTLGYQEVTQWSINKPLTIKHYK